MTGDGAPAPHYHVMTVYFDAPDATGAAFDAGTNEHVRGPLAHCACRGSVLGWRA